MADDSSLSSAPSVEVPISTPPFIWPDPRFLAGQLDYISFPPILEMLESANLISGVLVGVSDGTVKLLNHLITFAGARRVSLVLVLYPACPTREEHLLSLDMLRAKFSGKGKLDIRLFAADVPRGEDSKRAYWVPSILSCIDSKMKRASFCIGSAGDAGSDPLNRSSFNVVFAPDQVMQDSWRRWFQYLFSSSVELTAESARIPHLVPAEGDHQAGAAWDAYVAGFAGGRRSAPVVNSETGEVTQDADGKKTEPWDRGVTVLDPLAQVMQRVYSNGVLVTVNEGTRIRPLSIPVKATLLGQQAERAVGALTQKQSFSLQVLDESIGKEVEKCRKITDLIEVLTFPLSLGNRWLPERAQELLDRERKAREERGRVALRRALGGKDVGSYVTERRRSIQKDLNDMYRQLGQGDVVPEEKVNSVLSNIEARLNAALNQAITPTFTYNRIGPPDLAGNASEENWDQPAALLMRAARTQREALVDGYFSRRISGMSFAEDELCDALNVFDDTILKNPIARRARSELEELDEIESKDLGPKSKFTAVWKIIRR